MKRFGRLFILVLALLTILFLLPGRQAAAQGSPVNLTIVKETDPDGGGGFPFSLTSSSATLLITGNGGTVAGNFRVPKSVAVDSVGNFFVADTQNNRIQKFSSSGTYLTQWGAVGSGNGQFNYPEGVAIDSAGNVYVADTQNNRIQKFSSSGTYLTQWGAVGSGNGQLNYPRGVAVDSAGNVYVADTLNNRIQKFSNSGTYLTQWGAVGSGNGQFNGPRGVAVDSAGNVYVADRNNHRIQKFSSSGTYLTQWGTSGSGNGQFVYPEGVAVDSAGNFYVADRNNHRIQKFSSSGTYLTQWGTPGNGNGQFVYPEGVAVDSAGNVYVADTNNNRIQKFDSGLAFADKWGATVANNGQFSYPQGVTVDSAGNVYVADTSSNRVVKFSGSGVFMAQWGTYGSGNGQFNGPRGVAVDSAGNVYVADTGNHRIQKFSSSGTYLAQWGTYGSGNGQFVYPQGVAVDSAGNVYVAARNNNRIQKFSSSGTYLAQWGTSGSGNGQFNYPEGVAVDSAGNVFVADTYNHRIQKFSSSGTYLTQWGTSGSGNGQFNYPEGVGVDSAGNVFVADRNNHRIQKFSSSGTYLTQWGAVGSGNGRFQYPWGVAVDSAGNVYVADTNNHRIQKFVSATPVLNDDQSITYALEPGTFSLAETVPSGWELASIDCDGGNPQLSGSGVTLALASGNDVTCTFTNSQPNSITVVKEVVGGTAPWSYGFTGDLGAFDLTDALPSKVFSDLDAGVVTISETAVPGFTQAVTCTSGESGTGSVTINLDGGEDVTCTFTNTGTGSITVIKDVVGGAATWSYGFTGDLGAFSLTDAQPSQSFANLVAGSFTINETAVSGYSPAVSCDSGETGTDSVTVDLTPGENVVCTFTNTADPGSITIVKTVVGQTPSADWSFGGDLGQFTLPAAGGQNAFTSLAAGTYTIDESTVAGYSQNVSCDSNETGTGSVTVDLAPGEDVICTFTNTADPGSITIVQSVVGQVPGSDWSYDGDLGSFTLPAAGGQTVFTALAAGSYAVNETAVSGYSPAVSCDSGESGTGSVTVDLAPGEHVVCTFANTAEPGSITIAKAIVGQTPSSDWQYDGDLGQFTLPAAGGQSAFASLAAGSYTINETALTGYSQSASCDSGEIGVGHVTVDLAPGEDVVCTFTNTADPGSITIVKTVAGDAPTADWQFGGDLGAFTLPAAGGNTTFSELIAPSYTINETDVSGWVAAVSCAPGGATGDSTVTLNLAVGESAVCTFTNTLCLAGTYDNGAICANADPGHYVDLDGASSQAACQPGYYQPDAGATNCLAADANFYVPTSGATEQIACPTGYSSGAAATECTADPGSITLVKTVIGQVPGSDWTFGGDLGNFTLPASGGQSLFDNLGAGIYTITETAVNGYSQSVSCDSGETGTGEVVVDLQAGESVICTYVNTADAVPTAVVKLLDSQNNGIAGGSVTYYQGGWHTLGDTDSNGLIAYDSLGLTGNVTFRISYGGASIQVNQNVGTNPEVVFQTTQVSMKLLASDGVTELVGDSTYYANGWKTFGAGATATSMELLPTNYTFRVSYGGAGVQKQQNVAADTAVVFQTTQVSMKLLASDGVTELVGDSTYYASGWKTFGAGVTATSMELLPTNYTFRVSYGGAGVQKQQNIAADTAVVFQTTQVSMKLLASDGVTELVGDSTYYANGWKTFGGGATTTSMELLPTNYTFRVSYGGAGVQKQQNIAADTAVVFQTTQVSMKLLASDGVTELVGDSTYYASGWKTFGAGVTATSMELLPTNYTFRVSYGGAGVQKQQNIAADTAVVFQTGRIFSESGTATQYYAAGWKTFNQDMELLPGTYPFRFSDTTPQTSYPVIGATVNTIH